MRKRFVKVVLLGALAFATTTSFISCKDYDDDINRIDDEIGQINQSLDELKTSIGNAGVKSVTYNSTTGKLTIVDSNDKSVSCTIAQNLPEYTVEVADGKIVLKKGGQEVSSANLPSGAAEFDPAKLTVNAQGEVLYDGAKTSVKIPTSSIALIEKDGVVVGYKITVDGKESTFYIADALPLTSLVFVPEAYLNGVEAMRATNLTYDKWTVNSQVVTEKGEIWNAPAASASESNITPDMVAYYHVNPVGVTMKQIKSLVLNADDKEFIGTRATGFKIADIDLEKCSIDNGILKVVFKGNSEAIQKIDASKITVLNLQATVEVNGGTKTIASDYAAIYKAVMKDFVLANAKGAATHRTHLYGADNAHSLIGKAEDAINEEPMCEVAYNNINGIDLSQYVETHYTEWTDTDPLKQIGTSDKTIANDKLADYGLKLVYSLSDYYQGDNKTLQSSFFANLNGSVLTAKVGNVTQDPIAAVGRMPLVRVELQRASDGEVVNVGWIKVQITRGEVAGTNYNKVCGDLKLQCAPKTYNLTFDEMNVSIYQKLGLTKEDFHTIYELKSSSTNASGQKIATLKADEFGEIVELNDADPNVETVCLAWTVTDTDQLDAVANNNGQLIATATYVPKNDKSRADVTVTFTATVKTPVASFDDGSKNADYWYNSMSNVRMNVETPGNGHTCAFKVDVDNVFEGNAPSFKLVGGNETASADFQLDKITYQYIFSAENEGVEVLGNDGKTYTLTVSNDGKELFADGASVAKIEGTEVAYQETDEAKAILNTYSHNETPFSAKMDMVLTNQCNMRLPMTDGKFNADFLRPINVHANEGQFFVDATDDGYTVNVLDLVYLTDWRDYKFAKGTSASGIEYDGTGYYAYYDVESIVADTDGITTNMNNNDIETKLLKDVNNNIKITQANSTVTANYGTLTYVNIGNNVKAFKIKVPITVNYKWGSVKTAVYMDVKSTEGN